MNNTENLWEHRRLDQVATIVRGVTYSKKDVLSQESEGAVMLLRATNIQDGALDDFDPVFIPSKIVKENQKLRVGDIVVASSSGSIQVVGKSARVKHDVSATFGAFCTTIRAIDIDPAFLAHYLQDPTLRQVWSDKARGSNINNLKSTDIAATLIPFPPIHEQKLIVQELDHYLSKLESALESLKTASTKAHYLFLASLEQAIAECPENSYQRLGDNLTPIDGKKLAQRGWSPQCLTYPQTNSDRWAVLKTTSVQHMRYEPQHNKELPVTLEPKAHLEVQSGDFLMTTTGPRNRCGVVCYVSSTPEKLIFSGKILRFRADSSALLPEWLELIFASQKYQKILDSLKVGSSDSSVSIGNAQVVELSIPLPSIEKQETLVSEVQNIKALEARFEREIQNEVQRFGELRRSLLRAAFTGK
jgi:type I restriction enzyme S subunit